MSVDKTKISSLWAISLASFSSQVLAVYPDVASMLEAARPTAAVSAPELNALIIAIDALPTAQQKFDALQTLIPSADGSLRAASEGPMHQMYSVVNDRLLRVKRETGLSNGDEVATLSPSKPETLKTKAKAKDITKEHTVKETKTETTSSSVSDPESSTTVNTTKSSGSAPESSKTVAAPKSSATATESSTTLTATKSSATAPESTATVTSTNAPESSTTTVTTSASTTAPDTVTTSDTTVTASDSSGPTIEKGGVVITEEVSKGAWIQILGNNTGQGERDFVPGYDADVAGILIGRDFIFERLIVGAAGGYTYADVDSRGPSGSYMDIKRYQGTLYGGISFECPFFIHAAITLAKNDYDTDRKILVPPVGGVPFVRIAWSHFSAWETDAYLEGGFVWKKGQFRAIPKITLAYSHFDFGGYVEQDAFGLDLYVKYDDMDSLPLGVGVKFEYENQFDAAYVVPEFHSYFYHDFSNSKQTSTALFTAGGFEFLSQGASPEADSFAVGAGIAVHSYKNTGVIVQYDFVGRESYHRHQAFIKVRHEWA